MNLKVIPWPVIKSSGSWPSGFKPPSPHQEGGGFTTVGLGDGEGCKRWAGPLTLNHVQVVRTFPFTPPLPLGCPVFHPWWSKDGEKSLSADRNLSCWATHCSVTSQDRRRWVLTQMLTDSGHQNGLWQLSGFADRGWAKYSCASVHTWGVGSRTPSDTKIPRYSSPLCYTA